VKNNFFKPYKIYDGGTSLLSTFKEYQ